MYAQHRSRGDLVSMAPSVEANELNASEWGALQDEVAHRVLGMSADEFRARYESGDFDSEPPDGMMAVLAVFPDLD